MPSIRRGTPLVDYFRRESGRFDAVDAALGAVHHGLARGTLTKRQLLEHIDRLRGVLEDQRNDRVPDSRYERLACWSFRMIGIQLRKLEDLFDTGGANRTVLAAEEDRIAAKQREEAVRVNAQLQETLDAVVFGPPS